MKHSTPYRQMELNPRMADGEMHSPEQIRLLAEKARQQEEFFDAQLTQCRAQRKELDEINQRKVLFDDDLNEIGMKLRNAVRRLEKELDSMIQEQEEISQINECLKRHLQILSSMQPLHWSAEGFDARLKEAQPKLERAVNDFEEAYAYPSRYRHTDIFRYKPGIEERQGINWADIRKQLVTGFYFHLPLFLLLLITWGVFNLITQL